MTKSKLAGLDSAESDDNSVRVIYKTPHGTEMHKKFSTPHELSDHPLVKCLLLFFRVNPPEFRSYLYSILYVCNLFCAFLKKEYQKPSQIPPNVLQLFSIYLSHDREYNVPTSQTYTLSLARIIKWQINQPSFESLPSPSKYTILNIIAKCPKFPSSRSDSNTFPAMSEIVENSEYDDLELLNSLICFSLAFLQILQEHRKKIISYPGFTNRIDQAKAISSPSIDWQLKTADWLDYDEIFNAIVASMDATLVERLLISNPRFKSELISGRSRSRSELYDDLKLYAVRFNSGSLQPSGGSVERTEYVTFEQLDIRNIACSSEAEEVCLHWLLAADRIQASGQNSLSIEDVDLTSTHLTINYKKQRSNIQERSSTAHKKKSLNYKVIKEHITLRKDFCNSFQRLDKKPGYFFQYPGMPSQNHASRAIEPIVIACLPNSTLYREITRLQPDAKLFQEFFLKVVDNNTTHYKSCREKSDAIEEDLKSRRLTVNVIAQSRAIVDPEEPQTKSPFDRYASEDVEADATAHSAEVSSSVYKGRSQTVHRLSKRRKFSEAVGKLQEEDARKLSSLIGRTKILSINQLDEYLGWETTPFKDENMSEFNLFVSNLEAEGYSCTPFGYLNNPTKTERIIVKTPIVAALILSYIQGCQAVLRQASTEERAHSIILNLCYAKMVLEHFDQATINLGKKTLEDYCIPPAVI
ncbi:hypothetical protein [Pseudomonas putida]|uniref:hypothetical protein n=1 Tax=Pseudomonas putida TaxID=303 RepID=UPI0027449808|nr:hypothetical protein [Pseudomonas putida]MDP9523601.1 hypothetical protein [Pseudomonas putida]